MTAFVAFVVPRERKKSVKPPKKFKDKLIKKGLNPCIGKVSDGKRIVKGEKGSGSGDA